MFRRHALARPRLAKVPLAKVSLAEVPLVVAALAAALAVAESMRESRDRMLASGLIKPASPGNGG